MDLINQQSNIPASQLSDVSEELQHAHEEEAFKLVLSQHLFCSRLCNQHLHQAANPLKAKADVQMTRFDCYLISTDYFDTSC